METAISCHESAHKFGADTTPLMLGEREQMRVVNDGSFSARIHFGHG